MMPARSESDQSEGDMEEEGTSRPRIRHRAGAGPVELTESERLNYFWTKFAHETWLRFNKACTFVDDYDYGSLSSAQPAEEPVATHQPAYSVNSDDDDITRDNQPFEFLDSDDEDTDIGVPLIEEQMISPGVIDEEKTDGITALAPSSSASASSSTKPARIQYTSLELLKIGHAVTKASLEEFYEFKRRQN